MDELREAVEAEHGDLIRAMQQQCADENIASSSRNVPMRDGTRVNLTVSATGWDAEQAG